VTAVAQHSSSAHIVAQEAPVGAGDVVVSPRLQSGARNPATSETGGEPQTVHVLGDRSPVLHPETHENVVSGRAVFQFDGILAEDTRLNLTQPAISLRLNVGNLLGTGMMLTVNARSYYDPKVGNSMYGSSGGMQNRAAEFSLEHDRLENGLGYGIGRLWSKYVGAMGSFDGAQVYYRMDHLTAGVLGGSVSTDQSLSLDHPASKGAVFVNYRDGSDMFHEYSGTVAYGRQMADGQLDREFLYLQNSLFLGSGFSIFESSELDLASLANGTRKSALTLSNTFFNISFQPLDWISANVGYDADRTIYLLHSMNSIPDSLIDRSLQQGLRSGLTSRVTSSVTLSANASYGTRQGNFRDSHSLGGSARAMDLFGIDVNGALRYTNYVGAFVTGSDYSVEIDRGFGRSLSATLRYDHNAFEVGVLRQSYSTQTAGADLQYNISRNWFSTFMFDYVYDPSMNSFRIVAEIGVRF
jgi:hypothetical protein